MKKIKSLLSLMALSLLSQAQVSDMQVEWGNEIPAKKMVVNDILTTGETDAFYAINQSMRLTNRQTFMERYENLERVEQVELEADFKRGESTYQDIIELNDKLYALTYRRNKIAKSLTAQGVDPDGLNLSGSEETIYNIKLNKSRRSSTGEYRRAISRGETKLAYIIEHPGDKNTQSRTSVKMFNDDFELLWDNKISLKSSTDLTSIYSVTTSDDGIVYILTKVYAENSEQKRRERNYEFYLVTVSENGVESEDKLQLEDKFITELKLDIASNGDLLCGGFYGNNGFLSDGTFYMTLNSENFSVETLSLKEFDLDFMTQGMKDRAKKKATKKANKGKDLGLAHVDFRDIVIKEDGGAVLIGEYVNIYTVSSTDANGNTTTTTHYYYNDIFVINVNADGEIEWAEKILKTQHTTNDGGFYSSFFMVVGKEDLNFMFNIQEKRENILHAVSMDADGKQTSSDLVAGNKEKLRIRPKSCEQISDDEFILFSVSRKSNKFGKVKIN